MKRMSGSFRAALLALGVLVGTHAFAQDAEAVAKARKLRAEAAYQELKGNREAALKSYRESLQYVKDAGIEQKIAALGAKAVAAPAGGARAVAGEVYSRLDVDGDFLLFLGMDDVLRALRGELKSVVDAVNQAGGVADGTAKAVLTHLDPALEWLGLYAVHGVGFSLARQADGAYDYKEYWLGGEGGGALWRLAGKPVAQELVDYLPAKTAAFVAHSAGVKSVWETALEGAAKFAGAEAKDALVAQVAGMKDAVGVDVQAILQSIEDEWALAVTLDPATTISIPTPDGKAITIPEPGLLLALDVADGTIAQSIRTFLEGQGTQLKETKVGDRSVFSFVLPEPLPVPVPFEPAMVMVDDTHFLFALHPSTLEAALASKAAGGALRKGDEFVQAFAGMPAKVNGAFYMGKLFSAAVVDLQKVAFEAGMLSDVEEGGNALAAVLAKRSMEKLAARRDNRVALYSVGDADGVLTHGRAFHSGMHPIAEAIVTPLGFVAAVAMNSAEKARQVSLISQCRMNLYQILSAQQMWQAEKNIGDGVEVKWEDLKDQLPERPKCPKGGEYKLGKTGENPSCSCGQTIDN